MTSKQYAHRDIMEQDEKGGYFLRHMEAMTAEGLHSKSDIAAELAHRDILVDDLAMLMRRLVRALKSAGANNDLAQDAMDYLRKHGLDGSPLRSES